MALGYATENYSFRLRGNNSQFIVNQNNILSINVNVSNYLNKF